MRATIVQHAHCDVTARETQIDADIESNQLVTCEVFMLGNTIRLPLKLASVS